MIRMKIYILLVVIILFPRILLAQQGDQGGLHFIKFADWEQVKEEAKRHNKFIFVDCFTTWCGPCKRMDQVVYGDATVGSSMNRDFISIKVQLDSTGKDDEYTKQWYARAREMMKEYSIYSFPTYLFFSADGQLLHRGVGFLPVAAFITLANNAMDSNKQCYSLFTQFKAGRLNKTRLPALARYFSEIGEEARSRQLATAYTDDYLLHLKEDSFYTRDNLFFAGQFIATSRDKPFRLFLKNTTRIDKLTRQGYAEGILDNIIMKEEIQTRIDFKNFRMAKEDPEWEKIGKIIEKKYNKEYAIRNILRAKLSWYALTENWPRLVDANIEKIDRYGLDTAGLGSGFTNNMIYGVIFLHSTDRQALKKAIAWMQVIVSAEPDHSDKIDTYANLLYKFGNVSDAIVWEKKAASLAPKDAEIKRNLEKMLDGKPTWLTE